MLGFRESFTNLRRQRRGAPYNHLPFWYRHDRDQEQHAVDALLDAIAAARLRTGLTKADAAPAVNLDFGDSLELLSFVRDRSGGHDHSLPDAEGQANRGVSCVSLSGVEGIAAKPTLLLLPRV